MISMIIPLLTITLIQQTFTTLKSDCEKVAYFLTCYNIYHLPLDEIQQNVAVVNSADFVFVEKGSATFSTYYYCV